MRIAISNLAWDVSEDEQVAQLLAASSVDAIDIAPGKYFPDPGSASASGIARVRRFWADRGIDITGMQALLFGTTGLNLFGTAESRSAMRERLAVICRIGEGLGATRLVFGSPRNRDRGTLTDANAAAIAIAFFQELGEVAARHGVVFCIEPAPPAYGGNFLTTTAQTATMVRDLDHPAIRLHLDTGILTMCGEDAVRTLDGHADIVGHVHASEPHLVPLGDGGVPHATIADVLRRKLPSHVVSIEMVATQDEPHAKSIARSLEVAWRCYG
jgi:D-psicose/D-tagatose/L-ribulose 3-epimerase